MAGKVESVEPHTLRGCIKHDAVLRRVPDVFHAVNSLLGVYRPGVGAESRMMQANRARSLAAVALLGLASLAQAYEVNDQLSVGLTLFGSAQYGSFDNNVGDDDKAIGSQWGTAGGGDLELGFAPTANDELYARGRYVRGNGLNDQWAGGLAPWATDLHDDHIDITADLQYMKDALRDGGPDRKAWIPGLRLVMSF